MKIHSVIDVITNSSTELFVCNTNKDIEYIKELLQELLDLYNKGTDEYLLYEDVFNDPFIYTKEMFLKVDPEYKYNYGYEKEENLGKIIIRGTSDNSIPYGLFDLIEIFFSTDKYHLG
jgi:hypothetical protein